MPNLDGTGPLGKGPMTGRGRGKGIGQQSQNATKECTCPKCGHRELQLKGTPCTEKKCPKCGTLMKGILCS